MWSSRMRPEKEHPRPQELNLQPWKQCLCHQHSHKTNSIRLKQSHHPNKPIICTYEQTHAKPLYRPIQTVIIAHQHSTWSCRPSIWSHGPWTEASWWARLRREAPSGWTPGSWWYWGKHSSSISRASILWKGTRASWPVHARPRWTCWVRHVWIWALWSPRWEGNCPGTGYGMGAPPGGNWPGIEGNCPGAPGLEGNCPGTPGPGGYPPGAAGAPGNWPGAPGNWPGAPGNCPGAPGNWPGAPGPGGKGPGADGPVWGKPGAVGWAGPPEGGKWGPPGAAPGQPGLVGGGAPFPGANGLVCLVFDASLETSSGIASASYRKRMQKNHSK